MTVLYPCGAGALTTLALGFGAGYGVRELMLQTPGMVLKRFDGQALTRLSAPGSRSRFLAPRRIAIRSGSNRCALPATRHRSIVCEPGHLGLARPHKFRHAPIRPRDAREPVPRISRRRGGAP
jgi:hypothetical protein